MQKEKPFRLITLAGSVFFNRRNPFLAVPFLHFCELCAMFCSISEGLFVDIHFGAIPANRSIKVFFGVEDRRDLTGVTVVCISR